MTADSQVFCRVVQRESQLFPGYTAPSDSRARRMLASLHSVYGPVSFSVQPAATQLGVTGSTVHFTDLDRFFRALLGMPSLDLGLRSSLVAGAKGVTLPDVYVRSLGESAERLAMTLQPFITSPEDLVFASWTALRQARKSAIDPEEWPAFAPEQLNSEEWPFERHSRDSEISWIRGSTVLEGREVYAPLQAVSLCPVLTADEPRVCYSSSIGVAAHGDADHAVEAALLEAIERDAVALAWRLGAKPKRLLLDGVWAQRFPANVAFHVFESFVPGLHVIGATRYLPHLPKYRYSAGTAAGFELEPTVRAALDEMAQCETTLHQPLIASAWELSRATDEVFSGRVGYDMPDLFFSVVVHYGRDDNATPIWDWLNGAESVPAASLAAMDSSHGMSHVLSALATRGVDPVAFRFDWPPDSGITTMRIMIPELLPAGSPTYPMLGHPRYFEGGRSFFDLNLEPLPFS